MSGVSIKEKVLKAVQELPQEITFEDAIEKLYFLSKIEKGLEQADAGRKATHASAKQRMQKWLK